MKKINYLITYNYHPEYVGVGKYAYETIEGLKKYKRYFRVLTTQPHYPDKDLFSHYKKINNIKRMNILFGNSFVSRFINYFRFMYFVDNNIDYNQTKLIVLFVPSIAPLIKLIHKKKKFNFDLIVYFQDIETNFLSRFNFINKCINKFFLKYCNHANAIITISDGMKKFLEQYTLTPVHKIYNWFSYDEVILKKKNEIFDFLKISEQMHIIMISLNYGSKINYELIIKILREYKNNEKIIFLFVGNGKFKKKFQNNLNLQNLTNAILLDHLNIQNYLSIIRYSSCNLLINLPNLDNTVYPSRLTSILGVGGNAVYIDGHGSDFYNHVKEYPKIGTCVKDEIFLIKDTISLYLDKRNKVNHDALKFSKIYLNQSLSIKKLENIFFN